MAMSIFRGKSVEPTCDLHDEVYCQHHSNSSEQDDRDLNLQPLTNYTEASSPPPPELPTWDTVPISNFPNALRPSFNSGYELRPGPRDEGKAPSSTWLDQDRTADYDPTSGLDPCLRPPIELLEGKKRRRPDHSDEELKRPKVPRTSTWQRGRIEGKRLPVTLSFATENGRSVLASYGPGLDNWPKSAWRPSNEEIDWDSWWNPALTFDKNPLFKSSLGQHGRPKRVVPGRGSNRDSELRDVSEITLGHPEARGCKGCFEIGQRCPLLAEGSRYPCDVCTEDDQDCEPILEPTKKRACLNCNRRRICCSYGEERSDHSQPCSNCVNKGLKCIAGPASGRTRTGPALDSALSYRMDTTARTFASCTQCRKAKKWCSIIKNKTAAKCNECVKNNKTCTFETIQRTNARAKCVSKLLNQPQTASLRRRMPVRNMTQFIKTKLAHPIDLNYTGDEPCQWCQDMGHGIAGLGGTVEVEVMDFNDGNGFIEISGGYFSAGFGPSRICDQCTFERLAIAACLNHNAQDLKQIEGMDGYNPGFDCVLAYLMPGMAATAPFSWCSICPSPAFYACCKPMNKETTELDAVEGGHQQHGCGLKLCDNCAESLIHEREGDLEALVEGIKEADEGGFGLRADVDLLLPSGELVRRIDGR